MKLNHLISVRYKAVGRDTPGPACCRQKGVVSVGNFVDQLEQAEARGIFARWYMDANFRKLKQKFFLGLGFGIKLRSWFDGEHSSFHTRNDRAQEQSSRQESAHSAEVDPATLRSVGSAVNAKAWSSMLKWLGSCRLDGLEWATTEQRSGSPSAWQSSSQFLSFGNFFSQTTMISETSRVESEPTRRRHTPMLAIDG